VPIPPSNKRMTSTVSNRSIDAFSQRLERKFEVFSLLRTSLRCGLKRAIHPAWIINPFAIKQVFDGQELECGMIPPGGFA
jgi:hypothetical protein